MDGAPMLTIVDQKLEPLKEKFRKAFHADDGVTKLIKGGIQNVPCNTPNG